MHIATHAPTVHGPRGKGPRTKKQQRARRDSLVNPARVAKRHNKPVDDVATRTREFENNLRKLGFG